MLHYSLSGRKAWLRDARVMTPAQLRRQALAALYPVPNSIDSYEEWERFEHKDIDALTRAELLRELDRVRDVLRWDDSPDCWLLERHQVLIEALR